MTRWAHVVTARPRWVLTIVVALAVLSGVWGIGVFDRLSQGGFTDPDSEASEVERLVGDSIPGDPDLVVIYSPIGKRLDDIGPQVAENLAQFSATVPVRAVTSYWTADPATAQALKSSDATMAIATITLASDSGYDETNFAELYPKLTVDGVDTQFAGAPVAGTAINERLKNDLVRSEAIALPITLALLIVIFAGVVAAAVPVVVGALAVFSALGTLRALTYVTDVSPFAINVTSLLGLGLAIDYGLFIVGRFREELESGAAPLDSVRTTVVTAGRTVAFSALLLICAFAGMLVFPQAVVRSLGIGAIAAVAAAATVSLTAVPAVLAVLGTRINAWTWDRGAARRGEERARRFWGRVVAKVLSDPLQFAVAITIALLLMAVPLAGARLGEISDTALPEGDAARTAAQILAAEFPAVDDAGIVVLRTDDSTMPTADQNAESIAALLRVPGVAQVRVLTTEPEFTTLQTTFAPDVDHESAATALRTIDPPTGTTMLVGGAAAQAEDGYAAIARWLPVMIAIMVCSTLVLLFLAFGSVVLPLKAVAMSGLSLAATFGFLTAVFQDGRGIALLGLEARPLEPTFVVLILAVVFGLSTDYEVFLLSRMAEARAAGADTEGAVRFGIERTARIVTAAALLLVVVTGAFTLSGIATMRFLGVGMIVALLLDATVVRMLLVPSLVQLMGDANWWAPDWLRRIHRRVGIGH